MQNLQLLSLSKKKEENHYDVKVAKEFLHKHQKYNSKGIYTLDFVKIKSSPLWITKDMSIKREKLQLGRKYFIRINNKCTDPNYVTIS